MFRTSGDGGGKIWVRRWAPAEPWELDPGSAISRRVGSSQEPNARTIPTRCEQLAGGGYHGNPGELQLLLLGLIVVVSAAAIQKTLEL